MQRASVRNIMICHQQKIHLQPEAMVNWKQQPAQFAVSGIFPRILTLVVGLELFVGSVDKG
jgi:hypothetical protein